MSDDVDVMLTRTARLTCLFSTRTDFLTAKQVAAEGAHVFHECILPIAGRPQS